MTQELPNIACVIPARWGSHRFPGKALAMIENKPMVAHVVARCLEAKIPQAVYVATDHKDIAAAATSAGATAIMTGEAASGSDRIALALSQINCDVVINVQGDEPAISGATIDAVSAPFCSWDENVQVTTAAIRANDTQLIENPNTVKVVIDARGNALYFSRHPIPHGAKATETLLHHGIYGYWRGTLEKFNQLPISMAESTERLEQLRFLHHGIPIRVVEVEGSSIAMGVDTPQDLERVKNELAQR